MHAGTRTGGITHSARTAGGDAGSCVPLTEHRAPHMFPHRSA